jgi:biopolymer transport protein ExbD
MAFQRSAGNATIAEMNITPLVDVMLVLLIIFMVAVPIVSGKLTLDLPISAIDDPPPPTTEPITLQIEADGALVWNGTMLPAAALDAALRIEAMRGEPPVLQILASDDVEYAHVAAVLGRARHAGLERIALP